MNLSDCISASRRNISDARRYLESGDAINRVPENLNSALLWAMEAWLTERNMKVDCGRGWAGTREAFGNASPPGFRSQVLSCYARVTALKYRLKGGLDPEEPFMPMEVWKKSAFSCLEETERAIALLIRDGPGS